MVLQHFSSCFAYIIHSLLYTYMTQYIRLYVYIVPHICTLSIWLIYYFVNIYSYANWLRYNTVLMLRIYYLLATIYNHVLHWHIADLSSAMSLLASILSFTTCASGNMSTFSSRSYALWKIWKCQESFLFFQYIGQIMQSFTEQNCEMPESKFV